MKYSFSFEFSVSVMHGTVFRQVSWIQMKSIEFILIKISVILWGKKLINLTLSSTFVRTKKSKPREVESFTNITQLATA